MELRIKKVLISLISLILCMFFYGCTKNVNDNNCFKYNEIESNLNNIFSKLDLESEYLYIVDINMEGFTIWIDNIDNTIINMNLETMNNEEKKENAEIFDFEYSDSMFRTYKRDDYSLSTDQKQSTYRVNLKEYFAFMTELDLVEIYDVYPKGNIDYYEIKTDGLYSEYNDTDLIDLDIEYQIYIFDNQILEEVNGNEKIEGYYLPVFLSVGTIIEQESYVIYNNETVAIIYVKRGEDL